MVFAVNPEEFSNITGESRVHIFYASDLGGGLYRNFLCFMVSLSCWLLLLPSGGWAFSDSELMSLSLEELMDIEVSSVGRKMQKVSESAAAVFVISQEDIRRSGVTSIPEALRMVPGLSVARIDGSKWAISSRGLSGRFNNNKMLVLIDGRSVYSPLFSSVYWDVQDTLLDDIERIEIIRGPGAALWGANAVNGVINVITKNARDTQGLLVKAGYGTEEEGFAALRYGARVGDRTYSRAFFKYFNRDRLQDYKNGNASDDWRALRGGFRLDTMPTSRDELTLLGEAYSGTEGQQDEIRDLNPAMLYNFVKFVRWPAAGPAAEKGLVLGVLGHGPLQEKLLSLAAEGEPAPLARTLQLDSLQELADRKHELQVLYISRSAQHDIDTVLGALQGAPILTVCDDELFVKQGGMMNFVRHNSRIRFDLNLDAAKDSNLQISSNLYDLARVIVMGGVSRGGGR